MWEYSLPEVLKMKEWVDQVSALETAQQFDHQRSIDRNKG